MSVAVEKVHMSGHSAGASRGILIERHSKMSWIKQRLTAEALVSLAPALRVMHSYGVGPLKSPGGFRGF